MRKNRFTPAYIRFNRQLIALQKGKIGLVKRLAHEARHELEAKNSLNQLKLRLSLYETRSRN